MTRDGQFARRRADRSIDRPIDRSIVEFQRRLNLHDYLNGSVVGAARTRVRVVSCRANGSKNVIKIFASLGPRLRYISINL